jgi:adenine/guanine phosphoribosyltransferase-like PRPP-binding protein
MAEILAAQLVRDIPNFPEPGIIFKDITPVLKHPQALKEVVDLMTEHARALKPDVYGTNTVEIHTDAVEPGQRVVVGRRLARDRWNRQSRRTPD